MPSIAPRPLIYMDHWAHSDISGDRLLRPRLLRILQRGTLLYSWMNLLETARTKGRTLENIASFLEEVGSHWAPMLTSSSVVSRNERAGILEPWRADYFDQLLRAPRVQGKLSNLVRRAQEPWAEDSLKLWEQQEAADIGEMISVARQRVRDDDLKLDGTADVPPVLDTRNVFAAVYQRYVRGSLKIERHQIDDLIHTIVPVTFADVVFLDGKTKNLLERMDTRAKVFSKGEIDAAFQYLESLRTA
jgi:hypothetical protein